MYQPIAIFVIYRQRDIGGGIVKIIDYKKRK